MTRQPERITAPFLDVVQAFLDAGGDELHGWAIINTTKRGGPTVYKILERLDEMGWVTARWDDRPSEPNKPRRRYYRLTGEAEVHARALIAERRPATPSTRLRPAFGGGVA
jgi:PadR family transcriptional regulator PadR